jgi:hypothetical protein
MLPAIIYVSFYFIFGGGAKYDWLNGTLLAKQVLSLNIWMLGARVEGKHVPMHQSCSWERERKKEKKKKR